MKIKKCPFCGAGAEVWLDQEKQIVFVECNNVECGGRSGSSDSVFKAIQSWNRREYKEEEE